jgi:hypothetical protein
MVVPAYNPSYLCGRSSRILSLRPVQAKLERSYLKKNKERKERTGGMAQVVGYFLRKLKAFYSIPSMVSK